MKLLTKIINSITKFFRTIAWCLSLSWNASKYYTVIRIITEILTPLFAIIASFIGKYVIDLLAGHENLDVISYDINVLLISLLIGLFVIGIIHAATQKTVEYCQAIHEDILSSMRKRTILTGALEILPELAVAWIGISIAMRVLYGSATVGDYSLYTGLLGQLWAAISMLSYSVMNIYDNHMKIENYKAIESFENYVTNEGTQILKQIDTIEFDKVSFTYPNTKESVLSDVSFYLHKDQKVALVGLNGSGKSTLIKLLLRLYEPSQGIIRINDTEIQEYTLESLRANFSVYFQDMYNYSFSLRENFLITDDGHDDIDKSMEAALKAAKCDDILEKTSGSFDINITRLFSPEGIELSGGQHQKLSMIYLSHFACLLMRR